MIRYTFTPTDRISIGSQAYRPIKTDKTHQILARCDASDCLEAFTHEQIAELAASPGWRHERAYFDQGRVEQGAKARARSLDQLHPQTRSIAIWNFMIATVVKKLHDDGTVRLTAASLNSNRPLIKQMVEDQELGRQFLGRRIRASERLPLRQLPCSKTMLKHLRALKASGFDPISLAPRKPGSSWIVGYFGNEIETLLQECVLSYANIERPTMAHVIDQTKRRFKAINRQRLAEGLKPLHIPSASTVRRRINELDPFETDSARLGLDAARKKYAMWSGGLDVQFPMERIEVDEWQVDLITFFSNLGIHQTMTKEERSALPRGRRWIYAAVDCASRCILGFLIVENPSAEAAVRLLNMIVSDNTDIALAAGAKSPWDQHGGILTIACDTGTAFCSDAFVAAVSALGGNIQFAPVKIPELRGRIERPFGTLATGLMPRLSGRTFSNPAERGDYDAVGKSVLDDDDLSRVLVYFIVDYYHNKPHRGLGGQTPANRWKDLVGNIGVSAPPDRHARRAALGHEFERKLSNRGLRFFDNFYSCPELREQFKRSRNRKFIIRIDPADIGEISVEIGGVWYAATPVKGCFDGISLVDWIAENRVLRQRYAAEAELTDDVRERAIANIQSIDKAARLRAGITPQNPSKAQLAHIERALFQGAIREQSPEQPETVTRPAPFGQFIDPSPVEDGETDFALPPPPTESSEWFLEDE